METGLQFKDFILNSLVGNKFLKFFLKVKLYLLKQKIVKDLFQCFVESLDNFICLCSLFGESYSQSFISNRDQQGKAYRFLAQYHLKKGHLDEAYNFAQKCTEFFDTKTEGKALIKEIGRRKRSNSERNPVSGQKKIFIF